MKSDIKMTGDRLQITRVFDAPRSAVFAWWAQAEKLQQWSGCKEATNCEVVMDFRVGGSFAQKMTIAVNGRKCEFSFTGTYEEIVIPERISYRADIAQSIIHTTIEFFDQGEQTKVVLTQDGFADSTSCKFVSEGTSESFDKLDAVLASQAVVR
jgi:uncharacterized protein YndB with AHSA1/START domain